MSESNVRFVSNPSPVRPWWVDFKRESAKPRGIVSKRPAFPPISVRHEMQEAAFKKKTASARRCLTDWVVPYYFTSKIRSLRTASSLASLAK